MRYTEHQIGCQVEEVTTKITFRLNEFIIYRKQTRCSSECQCRVDIFQPVYSFRREIKNRNAEPNGE